MTALVWFLSEAALPVSLGAAVAIALDVAQRPRVRVRHYRWRNRRFLRRVHESELRSHAGGGSEAADRRAPQGLSAAAGVERGGHPHSVAAPPAPQHLAGAALTPSSAASARPPRRAVLLMAAPACGYSWGSGCVFGGGSHSCAWPASQCTGAHKCGCGAGASS